MSDVFFDNLCRNLEPERVRTNEDLETFLRRFIDSVISQPTLEKAALEIHTEADWVEVQGYLPYPATCKALAKLIEKTSLPSVRLQVSPMDEHPNGTGFLRCQTRIRGLCGPQEGSDTAHIWEPEDPIRVLRTHLGYLLCQADNGYLAWVLPEEAAETLQARVETECRTGKRRSPFLDWTRILQEWKGVPYVWGGTGRQGIDCSGFVLRLYQEAGYRIPRDSQQQMLMGTWIGTQNGFDSVEEGDLVFFTHDDGKIGHVGISLGGPTVLHAQEGGVCIFSLEPLRESFDPYRASHCVFAKRLRVRA